MSSNEKFSWHECAFFDNAVYRLTPQEELFCAIKNNDTKRVQILLNSGVGTNFKNDYGYSPLVYAVVKKYIKIAKILLNAGADLNREICWSIRRRKIYPYLTKELINLGADPNFAEEYGGLALIEACESGDSKVVKMLLDAGADPNFMDEIGRTPLMKAFERGQEDIVEMLLDVEGRFGVEGL